MKTIAHKLVSRALIAVTAVFMLNLGGLATHAEAQTASPPSSYNVILMMSQPGAAGTTTVTTPADATAGGTTLTPTADATPAVTGTPSSPGAGGALSACSCSNGGTMYTCGSTFTGTITTSAQCPAGYFGTAIDSATGPYICSNVGVIEPNGLVTTTENDTGCVKYTNPVYGACGPACGASTETLASYSCVNAAGATVPNSACQAAGAGAVPPNSVACTNYSTCVDTPVYTCSTTCGTGTENLASYTCGPPGNTSEYTQAQCDSFGIAPPPSTNGACTATSSCTYTPSNPIYSPTCSNTCGTGTASLVSFTCTRSDGVVVDSSLCTPPAPTEACTSTSGCTYTPTGVIYSPTCSNTCGTGTENLVSFTCTRSDGVVVANSFCTAPAATQACTDSSGCTYTPTNITYSPTCSNTCGTGTENLVSFTCIRVNDGVTVDNSFCTPPAPTQACTDSSGCTYTPTNVTYSPTCSNTCGTGTENLVSFTCTRVNDGVTVDNSFCTPPAPTQACSDTSGCTYTPTDIVYSPTCSNSCGTGTESVTSFTCTRSDGVVVANSFCTPPAAQACTDDSGCTYTPSNVTYGSCTAACGTSTASLNTSWTCTRSDGVVVAQSYCVNAGTAPAATESCTDYHACVVTPIYGGCSANCGTGTETLQSYTCGPAGNPGEYSAAQCASFGVAAPASTNGVSCTDNSGCNYTYTYSGATYGACGPACGASTQALTGFTCTRSDGAVVADSFCQNAGDVPPASQSCTDNSACTYNVTGVVYSPTCSNTCGAGTEALAGFTCTRSDGLVVANSLCAAPAATQACTDNSQCVACGSDNGGNFPATSAPWTSNPNGLCSIGGVQTAAGSANGTYDGIHFGYTCSSPAGSALCQTNVITVGSDNGGNFPANNPPWAAAPNNLCQVAGVQTAGYFENPGMDANHFYYDCAGVPAVANVITVGPANGQTVSTSPFEGALAGQLCMVGGVPTQAYAENGAFNGSVFTYDCAGVPGVVYYTGYFWWPTGVACNQSCGTSSLYGTGYECARLIDGGVVDQGNCYNTIGAPSLSTWEANGNSGACSDYTQCGGGGGEGGGGGGGGSSN